MDPQINIRDYLQKVFANKGKTTLTLEEIDALLNLVNQIESISEKGLLIVSLADQLHKISNVNFVTVRKFMNDFIAGLKPEKPRRQPRSGSPRKRKPKITDGTKNKKTIEEIAQESSSNPSNFINDREAEAQRVRQQRAQSQGIASRSQSQNQSKRSADVNKFKYFDEKEYANQINRISEGVQFKTDNIQATSFLQNQNFPENQIIQDYSNVSSISQSFGNISNAGQKRELLLKRPQRPGTNTKKLRTTTKTREATMTKKKNVAQLVLDKNLTLERTRVTLNESISRTDQRSMSYEQNALLPHIQGQNQIEKKIVEEIRKLSVRELEQFIDAWNLNENQQVNTGQMNIDFTQFQAPTYQGQLPDFTSQPFPISYEVSHINLQDISLLRAEGASTNIEELSRKVNKPAVTVFMEMLFKMQQGQIRMVQHNPQQFSQIKIQMVQQN